MSVHDCPCCECEYTPTPEELAEAARREAERKERLVAARWTPACDAFHQLRRELASMARGSTVETEDEIGFASVIVYGKCVPEEMSAEDALALLAGRRAT